MAYYIPETPIRTDPNIESEWYLDEFLIDHNLSEYIHQIFEEYYIKAIVVNNRIVYNRYDKNFNSKTNILYTYNKFRFEMWNEFFSRPSHLQIYGDDVEDDAWKIVFVSDGHVVKHYYFYSE